MRSLLLALSAFVSTAAYAQVIELPRMTMTELAREPVPFVPPKLARDHDRDAIRQPRYMPSPFVLAIGAATEATPKIAAPRIDTAFVDVVDPMRKYPADAAGAVGPHHVIGVTNDFVVIHDRAGKTLSSVFQEQFWSDTTSALFDPRIAYDSVADRWVTVVLSDQNLNNAFLYLAVSATGDPMGAWRRFKIPANATNNQTYDLDFSRLALGGDRILVNAFLYNGDAGEGSEAFIVDAAAVYSADKPLALDRIISDEDIAPVTSTESAYFISESEQGFTLWRVNGTSLQNVASPTSNVTAQPILTGAQLGTSVTVPLSLPDFTSAYVSGGKLWAVQELGGVIVLNTYSLGASTASTYVIADPAGKIAYAYPSMAVTPQGTMLVAYAVFDAAAYISSQAVIVDASGNVSAPVTIKNGEAAWTHERWGDFTTTVLDPIDHTTFWTIQIYPTGSTWATWWAHLAIAGGGRVRAVKH